MFRGCDSAWFWCCKLTTVLWMLSWIELNSTVCCCNCKKKMSTHSLGKNNRESGTQQHVSSGSRAAKFQLHRPQGQRCAMIMGSATPLWRPSIRSPRHFYVHLLPSVWMDACKCITSHHNGVKVKTAGFIAGYPPPRREGKKGREEGIKV